MVWECLCWGTSQGMEADCPSLPESLPMPLLQNQGWNFYFETIVDPPSSQSIFLPHQQLQKLLGVHVQIAVSPCPVYFHVPFSVTSNVEFDGPRIRVSRMVVKHKEVLSLDWWSGGGGWYYFFCLKLAYMPSTICTLGAALPAASHVKLPILNCIEFSFSWEHVAYSFAVHNVIVHLLLSVTAVLCICLRFMNASLIETRLSS